MTTYIATIILTDTWWFLPKVEQFEFQWGKKTPPTYDDIMREARALRRYRKYSAISATPKN